MSLDRLWAFLAVALPMLGALIANLSSVDLAYQLRAGDEILASGAIPAADAWTYTALGGPWVDQQWGAQVALAGVMGIGSWTGLALLRSVLVGVTFGCLYVDRPAPRSGAAARVAPDARRVRRSPRSRSASGRSSSAWRSSRSCCCS